MAEEPQKPASDFLDQSEIDKILAQTAEVQAQRGVIVDPAAQGTPPKVEPYDFRNPAFLSEAELRRLRLLHEDFIRYLSARLSLYLRMEFGLKMAKLTTVTYSKFTDSLPNPTHLSLFKVEPLVGVGILDINPRLALTIADRLLGGRGHSVKAERYLTEIEISLLEDVIQIILEEWCSQWKFEQELHGLIIGHDTRDTPAAILEVALNPLHAAAFGVGMLAVMATGRPNVHPHLYTEHYADEAPEYLLEPEQLSVAYPTIGRFYDALRQAVVANAGAVREAVRQGGPANQVGGNLGYRTIEKRSGADPVDEILAAIDMITEQGEPAGMLHDEIEAVAMGDEIAPAVGGHMDDLLGHLDAAEVGAVVIPQEFIVVSGDIEQLNAAATLSQQFLHDVVVGLRPVPAGFQLPAVDDIADQVNGIGFMKAEEIK